MDLLKVESKWQKIWAETGLYKFNRDRVDKKWYVLEMFSYPSGAKLHAGHWYNYGPADTYARFKKMQGYEVFQPISGRNGSSFNSTKRVSHTARRHPSTGVLPAIRCLPTSRSCRVSASVAGRRSCAKI